MHPIPAQIRSMLLIEDLRKEYGGEETREDKDLRKSLHGALAKNLADIQLATQKL